MNNKRDKTIYWISTGLLTLIMLFTVLNYVLNHAMMSDIFSSLGYSPSLIYPLAVAKVLGLIAIWTRKSELLKTLAYAGFFLDTALAITAHVMANDGNFPFPLIALLAIVVSFFYSRKVFGHNNMKIDPVIASG